MPRGRDRLDTTAVALVVLLCAIWGLQQVTVKLAVSGGLPPIQQAFARSLLAAGCVCIWTAATKGGWALPRLLPHGPLVWPAALIACVFAVEFMTMFVGLRFTTASRGVLLIYTSPFITALGAHLLLPGERLRLLPAAGLVIAFGGVALSFAGGHGGQGTLFGDALCIASAVLWTANTLLLKSLPVLRRTSAARLLFFELAGSAPILLLASLAAGEPLRWPEATALAWTCLLFQSVIVAFASYLAWFWLILRYPAGRLSGFTFFTPIFGILAGAVILGEPVGLPLVGGGLAVAIGLRLLNG